MTGRHCSRLAGIGRMESRQWSRQDRRSERVSSGTSCPSCRAWCSAGEYTQFEYPGWEGRAFYQGQLRGPARRAAVTVGARPWCLGPPAPSRPLVLAAAEALGRGVLLGHAAKRDDHPLVQNDPDHGRFPVTGAARQVLSIVGYRCRGSVQAGDL